MTRFSIFLLQKQNGTRSENSDANFRKSGNGSNHQESFQLILF